jgi:hypothetical protein
MYMKECRIQNIGNLCVWHAAHGNKNIVGKPPQLLDPNLFYSCCPNSLFWGRIPSEQEELSTKTMNVFYQCESSSELHDVGGSLPYRTGTVRGARLGVPTTDRPVKILRLNITRESHCISACTCTVLTSRLRLSLLETTMMTDEGVKYPTSNLQQSTISRL